MQRLSPEKFSLFPLKNVYFILLYNETKSEAKTSRKPNKTHAIREVDVKHQRIRAHLLRLLRGEDVYCLLKMGVFDIILSAEAQQPWIFPFICSLMSKYYKWHFSLTGFTPTFLLQKLHFNRHANYRIIKPSCFSLCDQCHVRRFQQSEVITF